MVAKRTGVKVRYLLEQSHCTIVGTGKKFQSDRIQTGHCLWGRGLIRMGHEGSFQGDGNVPSRD